MVTPAQAEIDAKYPKPEFGYRYKFEPHEHAAIEACNQEHGFAIVKRLIDRDYVEELKRSVHEVCSRDGELGEGDSYTELAFVEHSKAIRRLLEDETFLSLYRALIHADEMTIHRSACIMKMPGAGPVGWHSDHSYYEGPPRNPNDVLNRLTNRPNGFWFYLNGTRPHRAGLAVIEGSHVDDWPGPEGFELTQGGKSFRRPGSDASGYSDFDVPGLVPLYTDPGDLIVFAAKTQHAAFPHRGDAPRYSCAIGFRPGREHWPTPWELPESAVRLKEELPNHLQPFVEHYTSIVRGWSPEEAETSKA